jgi:hypothetical protein
MKKSIPIWLTVIIIIETLPMFIGPWLAIFNPSGFPGLARMPEPLGLALLYSARNLAVGFAFIIAFILKDKRMLFILILIRLITDLIDLPNFVYHGAFSNPLRVAAIFFLLYYIPAVYALRYLWKQIKTEEQNNQLTA